MLELFYVLTPLIVFVPFGWRLSRIDYQSYKLPNRELLRVFCLILACQILLTIAQGDTSRWLTSLKIASFCFIVFIFLYLLSRAQLGMGDVKYSAVLGLVVGWTNPDAWLIFIWLSFVFAAVWSAWKHLRHEIQTSDHIAFGPFLTVALIVTCLPIVL